MCGASLLAAGAPGKATQADLDQLRSRIESLRENLTRSEGERSAVRIELRDMEQKIALSGKRLHQIARELQSRERKLDELRREQAREQEKLGAQRNALAAQMRAAYIMGREPYLKLLLNQQDPSALGRSLAYYGYFNRLRSARMTEAAARLSSLARLEQGIREETAQRLILREREQAERKAYLANRAARTEVLAKLNSEIRTRGDELERAVQDEKRLAELLRKLEPALARIPRETGGPPDTPFAALKGKLHWPVQGQISAPYGSERLEGRLRWQGVLIEAPEGNEVHAVSRGRVAFSGWLRGLGQLVIVDHGGGYLTLYGHNQALYKEAGDWVEAGEAIASVGASGGRDKPALYFEVREQGEPRDPALWCARDSQML
ncbi:MAG: peptidase M23 [Gammaproteobacteria bacterium]|nr:MAG: peptidase M23 [Gammaproteobacteria bacterium]